MSSTLAPAAKRATTRAQRDELYRLIENGYFGHARVEIIEGELWTALPEGPLHDEAIQLLYEALLTADSKVATVYRQNFVEFPSGDALQPDVFVVQAGGESEEPLLVIEVATTTLRRDRAIKSEIYAAAGVAEYWIVNPRVQQIEVRRDPSGSEYVSHSLYEGDDTISPMFAPDLCLRVDRLMPTHSP